MQWTQKHGGARSLYNKVRAARKAATEGSSKGLEYDAENVGFFLGAAGRWHGPNVIPASRMDRSQGSQQGARCNGAGRDHNNEAMAAGGGTGRGADLRAV